MFLVEELHKCFSGYRHRMVRHKILERSMMVFSELYFFNDFVFLRNILEVKKGARVKNLLYIKIISGRKFIKLQIKE